MRIPHYSSNVFHIGLVGLVALALAVPLGSDNAMADDAPQVAKPIVQEAYGKLPLSFEANRGQTDSRVKFLARGAGQTLFLTATEAVLLVTKGDARGSRDKFRLRKAQPPRPEKAIRTVVRMKLLGANPRTQVSGLEELPGKANYFIGKDPTRWRTQISTYAQVKHKNVYPGVDVVYYGNQGQLEYDLVVAPGADPNRIQLGFEGAEDVRVDGEGNLVIELSGGEVRLLKPHVYQEIKGKTQTIAARYILQAQPGGERLTNNDERNLVAVQVGFQVAAYDRTTPLVIDPVLIYSTYLGGSMGAGGGGIAVDASGNAYVTGGTGSADFPTTVGAFQGFNSGDGDAFVTKLNPAGTALVYSTYLGGSGGEGGDSVALDASGNAYVSGTTTSADFPTTVGAFQGFNSGDGDAFVTKLNPDGSALVYSSYLGGSDFECCYHIAVDSAGNAYVAGGHTFSANFPTTSGAFQTTLSGGICFGRPCSDAFVTKLNPTGTALVYSTYLGGSGLDFGGGLAVDASGNAYVSGETTSNNFPTTPGAFQTTLVGGPVGVDAFVAKLNPTGSALVYSTYLGGSGDEGGGGIAVDSAGNTYVSGGTGSTDFPTTPGAFQTVDSSSNVHAFVTKLNPAGSALVYSTYLGGSEDDEGDGIAVDSAGNAYVMGITRSADFPTVNPVQPAYGGFGIEEGDAWVAKLNPAGSALVYSTYLGGSIDDQSNGVAVDASGNAYVTGFTRSTNFPTVNPLQPALLGVQDAFVAKIGDITANTPVGSNVVVQPIDASASLTFANVTAAGVSSLIRRNGGPAPPAGFSLGTPPTYYEITTTALFTGTVAVCITYSPAQFADPTMLHLLHLESNVWVDVTTSNDTGTHVICGHVSGFSPFVITQSAVLRVGIDIKPGTSPNSINLGSGGTVPVAILSTPTFDARTVDPLTVTLASAPVKLKGKGTPMASFQDVNGDGRLDLVVHVDTTALELSETDKLTVLEGQTFTATMIRGTDSVRVVP